MRSIPLAVLILTVVMAVTWFLHGVIRARLLVREVEGRAGAPWEAYQEPADNGTAIVTGIRRRYRGKVLGREPLGEPLPWGVEDYELEMAFLSAQRMADRLNGVESPI